MSFTEAELEDLIVGLVENKHYARSRGDEIEREYDDVLIEADLRSFLKRRYAANGITGKEIDSVIRSLRQASATPVYDANRKMYRRMVEGETFVRLDRSQKDFHLQLIDFDDPDNNVFRICNQVVIKGPQQKRIPDAVVYVNGLPVVVWEFKSTVKENATIHDAFKQITVRYVRDIPELFKYNAFVVISDGVNSKMGSLFAEYEHFYAWRKVDEDDDAVDGVDSLYTMVDGLFTHERLLDVIHNFVYFPDSDSGRQLKVVCSYPQYFAATKLHRSILAHRRPVGDGKGGTYFGTTGCGKSYGMLFLTRLLMRDTSLSSPTIVLITDRTDLDEQLSAVFVASKEFIGDKDVRSILSREDLGESLKSHASGGVYLTTIQKFTESLDLLTDRSNVIVISDEAHRSQLNLDQKIVVRGDEVKKTYGYARYLHESLPEATYVGFTGTPISETIEVFGPVVEEYTMRDSIKDGITVKLVYDGRFAKAVLDEAKLKKIEEYYEQALEQGANKYQVEESKKKSVGIRSIIGDRDVLTAIAKNFVEHYESRVEEGSTVKGKALFVCADRFIAWDFYKIVAAMRPEWVEERKCADGVELTEEEERDLKPYPMMKMVATSGKDDPAELFEMLGNDADREEAALEFKDERSNFKIAIVVDMWLTGFDVPCLDTIYIDKLLTQEHNIIQTISRVNRAYPGKDSGLIVDFIGIKIGVEKALKKYAKYDPDDIEGIEKAIGIVRDQLDVLDNMLYRFDSTRYFTGNGREKLDCLKEAAEFVQVDQETEDRFMRNVRRMVRAFRLCDAAKDFTEEELDRIHYYSAIRSLIFKLNKGDAPDIAQMNAHVQKMVQDAISSEDVTELFTVDKDMRVETVDLFDDRMIREIDAVELPNTKIKILQQLLSEAIEDFKRVNRIKSVTFSERLRKIVEAYNDRSADPSQVADILNDIAEQLVDLMRDLKKEKDSFKDTGIDYEEKAFYDILVTVERVYDFYYPDDKNIELARSIHRMVTEKAKYADWANRDDIKAEMQADIITVLYDNGFPPMPKGAMPPEDYERVYNEVIVQAENFKKYYNV